MPWALLANKWVIGALLMAGLGAALYVTRLQLDAARAREAQAVQAAVQNEANARRLEATLQANLDAVRAAEAERDRINRLADGLRAENARIAMDYTSLKRKVVNDQTPVTPDWCAFLDELRAISGAPGPACGNPG